MEIILKQNVLELGKSKDDKIIEELFIGWLIFFSVKQRRQKCKILNEKKKNKNPKTQRKMTFQSLPPRTLYREVRELESWWQFWPGLVSPLQPPTCHSLCEQPSPSCHWIAWFPGDRKKENPIQATRKGNSCLGCKVAKTPGLGLELVWIQVAQAGAALWLHTILGVRRPCFGLICTFPCLYILRKIIFKKKNGRFSI